MEIHRARELLGISENATLDELESRFIILIKREKNAIQIDDQNSENNRVNFGDLNEAYEIVKADILQDDEQESISAKNPTKEKIDHFFHYYKFHLIAGVITIILIVSIVSSIIEGQVEKRREASLPSAAIQVVLLGEYYDADLTVLVDELKSIVPEWERIKLEFLYTPPDNPEYIMRNTAQFTQLKPDILIVDNHQFEFFVKQNAFIPLDDIIVEHKEDIKQDNLLYSTTDKNPENHLYGINITNHSIFDKVNLGNEKNVVMFTSGENRENAELFIKRITDFTD